MSALGCGEHESVSPQCKWGPRTPLRAIGAALPAPALSGFAVDAVSGAGEPDSPPPEPKPSK
jgi:hypothetical protein